jgi:signal transduction histidine kinase
MSERVQELSHQAGDIAGDVHRLSYELHPSKLEVLGLVSALRSACADMTNQYGVRVEFCHRRITTQIPSDVALCFFRIVQEALRNVVKHSGAREATVRLAASPDRLHLHVSDRGIGFDTTDHGNGGLGLVSMRERVHHVGGRITIRSSRAHGTRIAVHAPFASQPSAMDDEEQGTKSA